MILYNCSCHNNIILYIKNILISFVNCYSQHLFQLYNWLNSILFFGTEMISEKLQLFLFPNDQVEAWRDDSRLNLPNHISEKIQNFSTNITKKSMTWSLNTPRIRQYCTNKCVTYATIPLFCICGTRSKFCCRVSKNTQFVGSVVPFQQYNYSLR